MEDILKFRRFIAAVLLVASVFGCTTDVTEIQSIDIDYYEDNEKNAKLAEDIIYYDGRYIASHIPAFDEKTSQGIKLGYFIRSSDGKASYRITYSRKNLSVSANIDELKKGFESFIPKLASDHASKSGLFKQLSPKGKKWVESLFSGAQDTILSESSEQLISQVNQDQLSELSAKLSSDYGASPKLEFIRGQFYKKFSDAPELVSLHYLAKSDNGKSMAVTVSTNEVGGKWVLLGFRFEKIKS